MSKTPQVKCSRVVTINATIPTLRGATIPDKGRINVPSERDSLHNRNGTLYFTVSIIFTPSYLGFL